MKLASAQQHLKRILKDNMFRRHVLSKSGRLSFNQLARYKVTQKIFSKPQENQGQQYHVELLLDNSGSMYHSWSSDPKARPALKATESLCKLFGPVSDLRVTMFNYQDITANWKSFDGDALFKKYHEEEQDDRVHERVVDGIKIIEPCEGECSLRNFSALCGNWDMVTFQNAVNRLVKKEGKKIILVLSDGRPNLDRHDREYHAEAEHPIKEKLKIAGLRADKYVPSDYLSMTRSAEKNGIFVHGFGIKTNGPKEYFDNFTLIENPEQIYEEVIKALQGIASGRRKTKKQSSGDSSQETPSLIPSPSSGIRLTTTVSGSGSGGPTSWTYVKGKSVCKGTPF